MHENGFILRKLATYVAESFEEEFGDKKITAGDFESFCREENKQRKVLETHDNLEVVVASPPGLVDLYVAQRKKNEGKPLFQ